jgi:pyruvate/2-oxoglutarate dehydrogenase complex dihydrolipoamide dehydrogenase (E3) component
VSGPAGSASTPLPEEMQAKHPRLEPWDAHNRRLAAHVHPVDWVNPPPRGRYHLVVVGAGTAGLVTAAVAAALGARVALIERHLMGGDCLNVGCVPSKSLLRAARAWSEARGAHERFGGPEARGPGDFGAAMERMRRLRADIAPVDGAPRFRGLGVDVFLGEGRFTAPDALEVDGRKLHFRRAVVATGGRPRIPSIPGLADAGYLTNETVFSLPELPTRTAVIGGGPIGCELAQAFARFGSGVTLLEQGSHILPNDDPEAAGVVASGLRRDGVDLRPDAEILEVARRGGEIRITMRHESERKVIEIDSLVVAVGRSPNVEGLGLEAAGVDVGDHGVEVDDRMRTRNRRIYAIGDVASHHRFTHTADAQARMVVQNALFFGRGRVSTLVVPWCTYTSPELAHVGITAREAAERGAEIETITIPMAEVDRARLEGAAEGFFRVYLKRRSDRILGATMVAEHAGEIISQITTAMVGGMGLGSLGAAIFPYPTRAEVVRKAADAHRRKRLTPAARRAFEHFFRALG